MPSSKRSSTPPHETDDQTIITQIPDFKKDKEKQAYIVFLSGPMMGKIHLLEERAITLGRATDIDIPINDLGISRHHASIQYKNGKAIVRDLGSTNGTYLNGRSIKESELQDGDKIQISSSTIIKFAHQDNIENIFHHELYRMAVVDALTGAYNKRYFEERLREEFSYCLRNNVSLSLMMLDLDHFKNINDTYGHQAGDFILSRTAILAKSIVRNEDILARIGGEEFAIILKAANAEGTLVLAERLRRLIDETEFDFEGNKIHITVSIGLTALSGENFSSWETMFKLADTLLYKSKNSGRNKVSTD